LGTLIDARDFGAKRDVAARDAVRHPVESDSLQSLPGNGDKIAGGPGVLTPRHIRAGRRRPIAYGSCPFPYSSMFDGLQNL